MTLKTLNYIRNKSELQSLYLSQYPAEHIRQEINEIIAETRKQITQGARMFVRNISTQEAIIFIDRNGVPDGYVLSEEMRLKIEDYKKSIR